MKRQSRWQGPARAAGLVSVGILFLWAALGAPDLAQAPQSPLAASSTVAAQAAQKPGNVLKSTTLLVEINVVVKTKKGDAVSDLTQDDFTLTDQGKPQPIQLFFVDSSAKPTHSSVVLPQNVFSNTIIVDTAAPNSVTVILLDALNTEWSDQSYAYRKVTDFLKGGHTRGPVALYALDSTGVLRVLQTFTTDRDLLLKRLRAWHPQVPMTLTPCHPIMIDASVSRRSAARCRQQTPEKTFFAVNRIRSTTDALLAIANNLKSVPGRKELIWVSAGFPITLNYPQAGGPADATGDQDASPPPSPTDTVESADAPNLMPALPDERNLDSVVTGAAYALNSASVAIYPVDARGLSADPAAEVNIGTMRQLASETGGVAYVNRNDLTHAVQEAVDDTDVTYTLGYYPDAAAWDGRFHRITVRIDRPGLSLRYRRGYYAISNRQVNNPKTLKKEFDNAISSPLDYTAVGINARVDVTKKPATLLVTLQIAPSTLALAHDGGNWNAKYHELLLETDKRGRGLAQITASEDVKIPDRVFEKILQQGIVYRRQMPFAPKADALRIFIQDENSGSVGSLIIPLDEVRRTVTSDK
ncbi:MAG: VWA domain-containing protein [Terriglobia bacterium]